MSTSLSLDHDQIRTIPLFAGFADDQLDVIKALFEPVDGGGQLFERGQQANGFYLLTRGEVRLESTDEEDYVLRPLAIIGELGALTGRARNCTAVSGGDAELWRLPINSLLELFESSAQIGLGFQQNLMHIVAEKIARDQTRMQDMRTNIVATQKAMKQMRELLLESVDTAISQPLHDKIDGLIQQNRRANYRVAPPAALVALLRFDDGIATQVVQISRTHLSFRRPAGEATVASQGDRVSAVLSLSGPEIPISGVVLREINGRVDLELDPMLEDYAATLEGYLTRVQLLDFLV